MAFDIAELLPLLQALRGNQQQPQAGSGGIADLAKAINAPSQAETQRLDYQASQLPSNYAGSKNPFATGFFRNNASQISEEANLGLQGNNAYNQIAQLGQVKGVDANKLGAMNQIKQIDSAQAPIGLPNAAMNATMASPPQAVKGSMLPANWQMPAPLTGAFGTPQEDAANFQQTLQMIAPSFWAQMRGAQSQRRF